MTVSVLAGAALGTVALAWLLGSGSHGAADAGGGPWLVDAGGGDTGSGGVPSRAESHAGEPAYDAA